MVYSTLRAAIQAAIKQNDNEEITGNLLQSVLLSIVNTVGAGYNFAGVATPSTNPGTPDGAMFWIGGKGTYANFGSSVTIAAGYLGIFMWDGSAFTRSVLKLSGGEGVFDVTDYTGNEYANLSAALAAIPQAAKAGGMEIRFVQSSDHKYVQWRYMRTSTSNADFTDVSNWNQSFDEGKKISYFTGVRENGFLNQNFVIADKGNFESKYLYVPCKAGDLFSYSGQCGYNAVAYFEFDETNTLLGYNTFGNSFSAKRNRFVHINHDGYLLFQSSIIKDEQSEYHADNFVIEKINDSFNGQIGGNVHSGYLKQDGSYGDIRNYYSITSEKVVCSEGDTFYFKTKGTLEAVNYLLFNGDAIVGYKKNITDDSKFNLLTIPNGVDGVIFSSYNSNENDIVFQVFKNAASQFDGIFNVDITNVTDDVGKIKGSSLYADKISTYLYSGGFLMKDGTFRDISADFESLFTEKIPCSEGDEFLYFGYGAFSGSFEPVEVADGDVNNVSWIFYDSQDNVISAWRVKAYGLYKVIIPAGVSKIQFNSLSRYQTTKYIVGVYRKKSIVGNLYSKLNEPSSPIFFVDGKIDGFRENGYLRNDGSYSSDSLFYCYTTNKYPCSEGDVFYYMGYGLNNAVSYLLYNGGTIVGFSSIQSNNEYTKITIPSGVDGIVFSSFAAKEGGSSSIGTEVTLKVISGASETLFNHINKRNSVLYGKKINWLGDSYVANNSQSYTLTWEYLIAQKYNMTYRNYGINGNGIVSGSNPMSTRYSSMDEDADYVMVVGGTNDFNYQTSIADFKAALKTFFQNLVAMYTTSRIAVWCPFNDDNQLNPAYVTVETKIPLREYANAMEEVCNSIGIACFNSFKKADIFAWDSDFRTQYFQTSSDRAHLNSNGHQRFMTRAESFMLSL